MVQTQNGESLGDIDLLVLDSFQPAGGGAHCELRKMLDEARLSAQTLTCIPSRPPRGDPSRWLSNKTRTKKGDGVKYGDVYVSTEIADHLDRIRQTIARLHPRIILALGNFACLATTDHYSCGDWRGSLLDFAGAQDTSHQINVIPTYSPEQILRKWDWRYIALQDFRRARFYLDHPEEFGYDTSNFLIRPSFLQTREWLYHLLKNLTRGETPLGVDIETRSRYTTCIGIADSPSSAICIPLVAHQSPGGYWTAQEELELIRLLKLIFEHPNALCHGHNFPYDVQYIIRYWGIHPRIGMDTMCAWHVCYSGLQKSLAFVASMLLPNYVYWKDEGHGHNPSPEQENDYWLYNCKDAARTLELVPILCNLLAALGQMDQYNEQMEAIRGVGLRMMLRGTRFNTHLQACYAEDLKARIASHEQYLSLFTEALTGGECLVKSKKAAPWYNSSTQKAKIFYEIWGLPVQLHRSTHRPTTDQPALLNLEKEEPLLKPIFQKLIELGSMQTFLRNFCECEIDWDGRIRSSYGVGMTETFRWNSSEDVFSYGTNLQNTPVGNKPKENEE